MLDYFSTDYAAHSIRAITSLTSIIQNSPEYASLPKHLRKFIDAQLSDVRRIKKSTPSSALFARQTSTMALHDVVGKFFGRKNAPDPIMASFVHLDCEIPITVVPQYSQTARMLDRAKEALREVGLDGLIVVDVDLFLPIGANEPVFAYHVHGIVFSERSSKRKFRLKKAIEKLNKNIQVASRLKDGCDLTGKRPGSKQKHSRKMASYVGKMVAAVKVATVKNGKPDTYRDRALLTPWLAFHLLYAWSHIPILEAVVPVGDRGQELYDSWLRQVKDTRQEEAAKFKYGRDETEKLWRELLSAIRR